MARRGGLGTNLDALIPTTLTVGDKEVGQQNEVPISSISPNPRQHVHILILSLLKN